MGNYKQLIAIILLLCTNLINANQQATCYDTCVSMRSLASNTNGNCLLSDDCLTLTCTRNLAIVGSYTTAYTLEPCHDPVALNVNFSSSNGYHFSRTIVNTTTIPISIPGLPNLPLSLRIELKNNNQSSITISATLDSPLIPSAPILPEQTIPIDKTNCPGYSGPQNNPDCTTPSAPSTTIPASSHAACSGTCQAMNRITSQVGGNTCSVSSDCLILSCESPNLIPIHFVNSFQLEPCTEPVAVIVTLNDTTDNRIYSQTITSDTNIPLGNVAGSPMLIVHLSKNDDFSILLSASIHASPFPDYQVIPPTVIPVDKSNCPGYTGPSNPYCNTQGSTQSTSIVVVTTHGHYSTPTATHSSLSTGGHYPTPTATHSSHNTGGHYPTPTATHSSHNTGGHYPTPTATHSSHNTGGHYPTPTATHSSLSTGGHSSHSTSGQTPNYNSHNSTQGVHSSTQIHTPIHSVVTSSNSKTTTKGHHIISSSMMYTTPTTIPNITAIVDTSGNAQPGRSNKGALIGGIVAGILVGVSIIIAVITSVIVLAVVIMKKKSSLPISYRHLQIADDDES